MENKYIVTKEEVKELLKKANIKYTIIQAIILLIAFVGYSFIGSFSKSQADKLTIGDITRIADTVKAAIDNSQEIEKEKRQLKYNALLKSLNLIDAYYSNFYTSIDTTNVQKQYASIEEWRECINELTLTCDKKTIEAFLKIACSKIPKNEKAGVEMMKIYRYRILVREELGFGDTENKIDSTYIWAGRVNTDKNNPIPNRK